MAEIKSSYDDRNGKTLRTETSKAPSEGYELLRALTYDRKSDYETRRANKGSERPYSSTGGGGSAPRRPEARMTFAEGPTPAEKALRSAQIRGEMLRLKALESPPPMRMTTFASGANNYYTPDTNVMNGYQRALYLPQSSTFQPGGATTPEEMVKTGQSAQPLKSPMDLQYERLSQENQNAMYGR